jgi:hypothetical protein
MRLLLAILVCANAAVFGAKQAAASFKPEPRGFHPICFLGRVGQPSGCVRLP